MNKSLELCIYPKFRQLSVSDADIVKTHSKSLPQLSDYVFSNLLDWRLKDNSTEISLLNNNLVFRMADNYGKKLVTTFMGKDNCVETIRILLKNEKKLYHIPEFMLDEIRAATNEFNIEEDRNSFDYIFSVDKVLDLDSSNLKTKKKEVKNFIKKNPDAKVVLLDLGNIETQNEMKDLYIKWLTSKNMTTHKNAAQCEFEGLKRFMSNYELFETFTIGVKKNGKLIGFVISEMLARDYILMAYTKGDLSYRGLFSFMMYKATEFAKKKGIKYINHESDLGIPGLRSNKLGWRPVTFFKKYKVTKKR